MVPIFTVSLEGYISEGDRKDGLVVFEFLKSVVQHGRVVLWAEGERIPLLFDLEVIVCSVAKTNRIRVGVGDLKLREGVVMG